MNLGLSPRSVPQVLETLFSRVGSSSRELDTSECSFHSAWRGVSVEKSRDRPSILGIMYEGITQNLWFLAIREYEVEWATGVKVFTRPTP